MGTMKSLSVILQNQFPDEDQSVMYEEFNEWLNNPEKNMMFIYTGKPGMYANLCDEELTTIEDVLEYWCIHIKKGIHNGEGFVIKQ